MALTDRAKAQREAVATVHQLEIVQPVDHLADLAAAVCDEKRVRTTEVLHRLKKRNHTVYEHGGRLKAFLAEYGEEPGTSGSGLTASLDRSLRWSASVNASHPERQAISMT
ncbi:hypothetical protein ABZ918_15325 [Streptomyces viridosporus]|uniref:hypothetical protein n=1 Tax=Streptomyces TaxID=1883 RepID=UPI000D681142|nr:hypothetical protein [Streptomyces sp. NWU49]PWJ02916.1 hypothetical protein DKG34_35510 [Streptomyces sp. NWU49]